MRTVRNERSPQSPEGSVRVAWFRDRTVVRRYDDKIWDAGVRCGQTSGVCLRPKIGTREVPTPPLETNPKIV
jgi:hypothetical protein